ncbi:unnamed protein product [Dicrocoelium dendriticum]|nr:unnamed protein product [Dicrocoelium dendriticum]
MSGDYAVSEYNPLWKRDGIHFQINVDPDINQIPDFAYGSYDHTMNPIFLFLPYIEPVSSSEDIVRMMAYVLLETQLTMTLFSPPRRLSLPYP